MAKTTAPAATVTITEAEVWQLVDTLHGKFLTVTWRKRTDGTIGTMTCTLNYQSHLAGGAPAYDHRAKGLVPVLKVSGGKAVGMRSFPVDGVLTIRANRTEYTVTH